MKALHKALIDFRVLQNTHRLLHGGVCGAVSVVYGGLGRLIRLLLEGGLDLMLHRRTDGLAHRPGQGVGNDVGPDQSHKDGQKTAQSHDQAPAIAPPGRHSHHCDDDDI